jgi:hypothetical protein
MSATADHPHTEERLTVVIDQAGGGWYAARIPEVPGAHGQGRTPEQARANVLEAMYDLIHEPSPTERVVFTIQARVVDTLRELVEALRRNRA